MCEGQSRKRREGEASVCWIGLAGPVDLVLYIYEGVYERFGVSLSQRI